MNCNSAHVIRQNFDLACMQSGSNLQTKVAHIVADSFRATHGAGGTVKRSKKPISERFNLFAMKSHELATHTSVMHLQKMAPVAIAKRNRTFGRANYICTVANARSVSGWDRDPVRNSSISSRIRCESPAQNK